MGHNNPRQKIQYHLRLKQELEEMRHECMLLLRERFHLEQCVRCCSPPPPGKCVCVYVCVCPLASCAAYHHRGLAQLILPPLAAPCGSAWHYRAICSHLGGPIHGTPRSPVRSLTALGLLRNTRATTCMVHMSSQQPGAAVSRPVGGTGRGANLWVAGPIRHPSQVVLSLLCQAGV